MVNVGYVAVVGCGFVGMVVVVDVFIDFAIGGDGFKDVFFWGCGVGEVIVGVDVSAGVFLSRCGFIGVIGDGLGVVIIKF